MIKNKLFWFILIIIFFQNVFHCEEHEYAIHILNLPPKSVALGRTGICVPNQPGVAFTVNPSLWGSLSPSFGRYIILGTEYMKWFDEINCGKIYIGISDDEKSFGMFVSRVFYSLDIRNEYGIFTGEKEKGEIATYILSGSFYDISAEPAPPVNIGINIGVLDNNSFFMSSSIEGFYPLIQLGAYTQLKEILMLGGVLGFPYNGIGIGLNIEKDRLIRTIFLMTFFTLMKNGN